MHQSLKTAAFSLALLAFVLLLTLNIEQWFDLPVPFDPPTLTYWLVAIALIFITVLYLNKTLVVPDAETLATMSGYQRIRLLLGNPPHGVVWIIIGLQVYALYGFYLFLTGALADPEYVNGHYQLTEHGPPTFYTAAEYQVLHRRHLLAVSTFFLEFYAVPAVVLAPWRKTAAT